MSAFPGSPATHSVTSASLCSGPPWPWRAVPSRFGASCARRSLPRSGGASTPCATIASIYGAHARLLRRSMGQLDRSLAGGRLETRKGRMSASSGMVAARQPENTRAGPRPHVGGALPVLPRVPHALAGRWPAHAALLLGQGPQPLRPRVCRTPAGRASRALPPLVEGRLAKVAAPMGGNGLREFPDGGTAGSLEHPPCRRERAPPLSASVTRSVKQAQLMYLLCRRVFLRSQIF